MSSPAKTKSAKRKALDDLLTDIDDNNIDIIQDVDANEIKDDVPSTPTKCKLPMSATSSSVSASTGSSNKLQKISSTKTVKSVIADNSAADVVRKEDAEVVRAMAEHEKTLQLQYKPGSAQSQKQVTRSGKFVSSEEDDRKFFEDSEAVLTQVQQQNQDKQLVVVAGQTGNGQIIELIKHKEFGVAFPKQRYNDYVLRFRRSGDSALAMLEKYWRFLPTRNVQIDIVPFGVKTERARLMELSMKKTRDDDTEEFKSDKEGYSVKFFYKQEWNNNEIEFGNFTTCFMTLVDGWVSVLGTSVAQSLDGSKNENKILGVGDGIKLAWRLSAHGHLNDEVKEEKPNIEAMDCIAYIHYYVEQTRKKLYEMKKMPLESYEDFCKNRCYMPVFPTKKYGDVLQFTTKIMRKRKDKQKLPKKDITADNFPVLECEQLKTDEDARDSMCNLLREYTPSYPRVAVVKGKEAKKWPNYDYHNVPFKKGTVVAVRCSIVITMGDGKYSISLRVPASKKNPKASIYVKSTNVVPIPEKTKEEPMLDDLFEEL